MKTIDIRRSVRTFKDQTVDNETIETLLHAGMQAPTAGNQQEWEFLVLQDRDSLNQLANMSPYAAPIKKAPLVFVLLGNTKQMRFAENWQQDLGACAENILLEAVEQKLGSVWMAVAPDKTRMKFISELYHLPEHILPFCVIALGYPEQEEANHYVDRYDAKKVHYERYE